MTRGELEKVYDSEFNRVYRFALALTSSSATAEEIAQESFLRLLKNSNHRPIQNAQAWLIQVARNLANDRFRRTSREHTPVDPSASRNPEEEFYADELRTRILRAIEGLSDTQRECLCLREFGELSYGQIAEVLGISLDEVKVQVFRARQNLRKKLGGIT